MELTAREAYLLLECLNAELASNRKNDTGLLLKEAGHLDEHDGSDEIATEWEKVRDTLRDELFILRDKLTSVAQ